jgi:hypothetical protein
VSAPSSFVIDFSDLSQKRNFMQQIGGMRGLWEVRLQQRKVKRTLNQNDYYWAAVVQPFVDEMNKQGCQDDEQSCHEEFQRQFLSSKEQYVNTVTGEILFKPKIRSTSDLSIEEFSAYIEKCAQFLAETFGYVVIPSEIWPTENK